MNSKIFIDQWLYHHLEKETFSGLVWEDRQLLEFRITWEKCGFSIGYKKTLEICKAYRERNGPAKPIKDSVMKNNLNDAINKSSNVIMVRREQNLQEKNFLLCRFKKLPERYFGSQQEGSETTALSRGAESIDVIEHENMLISSEENNESIFPVEVSEPMDLPGPMNVVDHVTERPVDQFVATIQGNGTYRPSSTLRHKPMDANEHAATIANHVLSFPQATLDTYNISLYYDGEKVKTWKEIDLRTKCRFHWGDRESQIQEAMVVTCDMQDSRIADLQEPSVSFPAYRGSNQKTTEYLKESDYGVLLSSHRGCITAKRLCRNHIYHSVYDSGKFEKLDRREEKVIFSLEDYIQGVAFKKFDLFGEVRLVYGKKPKPGVLFNICLEIKPMLMPNIHSFSESGIESSCSKSSEDFLDREVRLNDTMKYMSPIMDNFFDRNS